MTRAEAFMRLREEIGVLHISWSDKATDNITEEDYQDMKDMILKMIHRVPNKDETEGK
ncbi:hypothetical protein ACNAN0_02430 [Agrilactobacillus fermenti]|uniref:hypothetical protein n=1 Tax=Agrilactobacillus fermenti TaxID=2586909 RepID=UPI001E35711F|nr:hypothetical protein [Agrilactobacillus fermenti]MCD2257495.1 hypothetical protein [Agrilactobacillus fermenti]